MAVSNPSSHPSLKQKLMLVVGFCLKWWFAPVVVVVEATLGHVNDLILVQNGPEKLIWKLIIYTILTIVLVTYIHLLVEYFKPRPQELRWMIKSLNEKSDDKSINWPKLNSYLEVMLQYHDFVSSTLISTLCDFIKQAHQKELPEEKTWAEDKILKWASLPFTKRVSSDNEDGLSLALIEQTEVFVGKLVVAKSAEKIFQDDLNRVRDNMRRLRFGERIDKVSLRHQYDYAAGVAEYYGEHPEDAPTIYATTLDPPSEFFIDHKRYWEAQERLSLGNNEGFNTYFSDEVHAFTGFRLYPESAPKQVPARSRLVITTKTDLVADIQNDGFWKFIQWHFSHKFALKFFVVDIAYQDSKSVRLKFRGYVNDLMEATGSTNRLDSIDDFIVYGEECVYGRVNPKPQGHQRDVTLKMETERDKVNKYIVFFGRLWNQEAVSGPAALTISELSQEDWVNNLPGVSNRLNNLKAFLAVEHEKELDR